MEVPMMFAFAVNTLGRVLAWSSPTAAIAEQPRVTPTSAKVINRSASCRFAEWFVFFFGSQISSGNKWGSGSLVRDQKGLKTKDGWDFLLRKSAAWRPPA
jgi:hypothetical protein